MEIKKAVAELSSNVRAWKILQNLGDQKHATVYLDCAIPVAETLLAALDRPEGTPIPFADPLGALIRCPHCDGIYDHRYPEHLCDKSGKRPKLAGQTVDGWGWKVFWKTREGNLHSETTGRARKGGLTLPMGRWLRYQDFQIYGGSQLAFHIFGSRAVAQAWIVRGYTPVPADIVIRKVGWRELKEPKGNIQTGYSWGHDYELFTAEEIYILLEEGMLGTIHSVRACPKCGGWEDSHAILCSAKPAERPPEKGDWVLPFRSANLSIAKNRIPCRVIRKLGSNNVISLPAGLDYYDEGHQYTISTDLCRIVRRAADRLRVGDKVSFGSEEGWVIVREGRPDKPRYEVNFTGSGNRRVVEDTYGWFDPEDLTLLEPVYDRPAEKGDC